MTSPPAPKPGIHKRLAPFLSGRIHLALLMSLIPTIIAGYLNFHMATDRVSNELEGTLQQAAQSASRDVSGQIDVWHQNLATIGRLRIFDVAVDYQRFEGVQEFFDSIIKTDRNCRGILFIDQDHQLRAFSTIDSSGRFVDNAQEKWQALLSQIDTNSSNKAYGIIHEGTNAQDLSQSLTVSAPVFGRGDVVRGKLIAIYDRHSTSTSLIKAIQQFRITHDIPLSYMIKATAGAWSTTLDQTDGAEGKRNHPNYKAFCFDSPNNAGHQIESCIFAPKAQLYAELRRAAILAPLLILMSALGFGTAAFYAMRTPTRTLRIIFRKLQEISSGDYSKLADDKNRDTNYYIKVANDLIDRMDAFHRRAEDSARKVATANLTAMFAHDVRKPFSILRVGIELLQHAKTMADIKKIVTRLAPEVDKAIRSVDGMIADIMEVGSSSTGIIPEPHSPEALLESALTETFRLYPKCDIRILYNFAHKHQIQVDSRKIARVFANILENAIQAIKHRGQIWISTTEAEDRVVFCIGNAGSYIPSENLGKLFDAFFTSGKKGGTGLGLAIAKKVIEDHGGSIWCESHKTNAHPDGVVEFYFSVPKAAKVNHSYLDLPTHSTKITSGFSVPERFDSNLTDGDANERKLEAEIIARHRRNHRPLHILIVDDEHVYSNGLAASLVPNQDLAHALEIRQASDAQEALAILYAGTSFDLIITDVDMGSASLNGFELVYKIREIDSQSLICVHSNRVIAADHQRAVHAGANAFIPKPAARAQLLRLVLQAADKSDRGGKALREAPVMSAKVLSLRQE